MSYVIICAVALVASGLTLYSGFGLGTLLLPAFAVFFPVEIAVAATAVVHLLNNLFKVALLGSRARLGIVAALAVTAIPGALVGAWLLARLAALPPLAEYTWLGRGHEISGVKLVIALLVAGFAALELTGSDERLEIPPRLLPLGGLLTGFFGGLSGHQGALRSAFLIRLGLDKEAFIATGVVLAVIVDLTRIAVYGRTVLGPTFAAGGAAAWGPVAAATVAAFAGAWIGVRLLKRVTMVGVRRVVGATLFLLAVALGTGLV